MKKNLLLTFFLMCLLPFSVFAVEDPTAVTVTVAKPSNSYVNVTYTPFGMTTETTTTFADIESYVGTISVKSGTSLKVNVTPITSYAFDKIVIDGGDPIVENDYIIPSVAGNLTITTSVVRMYTFTLAKPANCDIEVEYFPAPLISSNAKLLTITPAETGDVVLKVKNGTAFKVNVIPIEGYALERITVSNASYYDNPYTISPANSDKAISVSVVKTCLVNIVKPINSTVVVNYVEPLGSAPKTKTLANIEDYDGDIIVKDGTQLSVTVNSNTGYEFSKTLINDEVKTTNPTIVTSVTADLSITTEVVKKKYLLTITSPINGSIVVMNGSTPVVNGAMIEHGSLLTISSTPHQNYVLTSLTVNGEAITSGDVHTVTDVVSIQSVFTYVAPKYVVSITQPANGEIVVRRKVVTSTTEAYVKILSGTEVTEGTLLYVDVNPDENYIVNSLTVNGEVVADGSSLPISFELTGATLIQADLEIAQQKITLADVPNGSVTVKNGTRFINTGDLVNRGTILALQAIPSKEYKFKQWWDGDTNPEREIVVGKTDITVSALFVLITGIEQVYSGMNVYAANNAIYLNGVGADVTSVYVVDMAGKVVYNSKPELGQTIINPVNRGIYIVVVKGKKGNVSSKVIVK